jgi:hypothetical protein
MDDIYDKNDDAIQNGDIVDIGQTLNGENLFIILNMDDRNDIDVRYARCPWLRYEYDVRNLLEGFTGSEFPITTELEIVGNIKDVIDKQFR